MDSARDSRGGESDRRRRRSRSKSTDLEEERQRRRRRRGGEEREGKESRSTRDDRHGGSTTHREEIGKGDYREHKRRRSRSPREDSHRRHRDRDRDLRRRERQDRSPRVRGSSKDRRHGDAQPDEPVPDRQVSRRAAGPLPSQEASFSFNKDPTKTLEPGEEPIEKQKPSLAPTGLLAAASNSIAQSDGTAIVLKYHEPPEARKPPSKDQWKLFVFKGADIIDTIDLSVRSCWLVGRELSVVDLIAEHPSISKQHAVIQFRYIEKRNEFGDKLGKVKPYLIDLESANGTALNKDPVEASRYIELRDTDMIQFGDSTREYVLMLPPK